MRNRHYIRLHDSYTNEVMKFGLSEINYIEPYNGGCTVSTWDDGDYDVMEDYETVENMVHEAQFYTYEEV